MPSAAERGQEGAAHEERLTVDGRIDLIRTGLDRWREGFLAYLLLPNIDLSDPGLLDHFTDCYAGWYPDRRSFVKGQVDSLGWLDALEEFCSAHDLPEGALDLDWDVVYAHCCEVYDVVERLGGVHVFMT